MSGSLPIEWTSGNGTAFLWGFSDGEKICCFFDPSSLLRRLGCNEPLSDSQTLPETCKAALRVLAEAFKRDAVSLIKSGLREKQAQVAQTICRRFLMPEAHLQAVQTAQVKPVPTGTGYWHFTSHTTIKLLSPREAWRHMDRGDCPSRQLPCFDSGSSRKRCARWVRCHKLF